MELKRKYRIDSLGNVKKNILRIFFTHFTEIIEINRKKLSL